MIEKIYKKWMTREDALNEDLKIAFIRDNGWKLEKIVKLCQKSKFYEWRKSIEPPRWDDKFAYLKTKIPLAELTANQKASVNIAALFCSSLSSAVWR